jgi:iron complex outermembrane receptor protein
MKSTAEEMDEIIITSTRGTRTISNIPTVLNLLLVRNWRKSEYDPETFKHDVTESTGIQTQQTSATGNSHQLEYKGWMRMQ